MSRATKQVNTTVITRKRAFLGPMLSKVRDTVLGFVRADDIRLLDIGCGNGLFFVQILLGRESKAACFGLDRSFENLQEAKQVFATNNITGCGLIHGDAFNLPFGAGTFDQVFCLNTVYNLPSLRDVEALIGQMSEVCAPDGSIVFDIRNAHNPLVRLKCWLHNRKGGFQTNAYTYRQIVEMLSRKGLTVVRRRAVGPPIRWFAYAYLIEAKVAERCKG
jgi:ubiquinone/menaquinone biosynthesis C-methylase UbiE